MITHRDQEISNVPVMKFRNFSAYVQRQIDRIFRSSQTFAKIYIDDIVIFSKTLKEYLQHLRCVFDIFKINNISIKFSKLFIEDSSIISLRQYVNSFKLITDEQKFKAIINIFFIKTLSQFEVYLDFTE